ncbi:MAG: YkvA family protein [Cyclobacteriaceae bacterium]
MAEQEKKNKKIEAMMVKAKETISSNERVKKLLEAGKEKLNEMSGSTEDKKTFVSHVQKVIRMIRAHVTGEFKAFSVKSMVLLVFSLIYFITPLDLLPDFIPALGFTDDLSILLFIFKSIQEDVAEFEEWEEAELAE